MRQFRRGAIPPYQNNQYDYFVCTEQDWLFAEENLNILAWYVDVVEALRSAKAIAKECWTTVVIVDGIMLQVRYTVSPRGDAVKKERVW